MKYTVYVYDSHRDIKSTQFVEANGPEEALEKAEEQYRTINKIRSENPFWSDGINCYLEKPWW